MAWSAPLTAVAAALLTASQYNASVRDNLLATAPPIATTPGSHFATTGTNKIEERIISNGVVNTAESTTSSTYANLATVGPSVTVTCRLAMVFVYARMRSSNGDGRAAFASVSISGSTTANADDLWAISANGLLTNNPQRAGSGIAFTLNAGTNTFTMKYRTEAGYTALFEHREIVVIPF